MIPATTFLSLIFTRVAAQVALTREAGKNDKLAELLRKDGISSVEVRKSRRVWVFTIKNLYCLLNVLKFRIRV